MVMILMADIVTISKGLKATNNLRAGGELRLGSVFIGEVMLIMQVLMPVRNIIKTRTVQFILVELVFGITILS